MGVMTLVNSGKIIHSDVVNRSVFPERTLLTKIDIGGIRISNLAFHSLTGVGYKKAKSSNFTSIASFIHTYETDIMTCDANEPKVDSIDNDSIEFFDQGDKGRIAALLMGKKPVHELQDTFKQFSIQHNLPLVKGYTYDTGKSKKRYDHIYCKSDWNIISSTFTLMNL